MTVEILNIDKQGPIDDQSTILSIRDPNVEKINKWLKTNFGTVHGRQVYRLVWSENLWETRIEYQNVLGEVLAFPQTIRDKKYTYINNRWIFEKLVNMPAQEIAHSQKGHYEPIHVFQDKHGEYLEPIQRMVELLVYALLNGTPWTKEEWEAMDLKRQEREVEIFEQIIGQDSTDFLLKLRQGETNLSPGKA